MSTVSIALSAHDWVTARGVQQLLETAGYEVVLFPQNQAPTLPCSLAIIEADSQNPTPTDPMVSFCASNGVPVVWLSSSNDLDFLVRLASTVTVGVIVPPFPEKQILATVMVGLTLAAGFRSSSGEAQVTTARPSASGDVERSVETLPITRRQREIVLLLLHGARVSTIAESLGLSPSTVRAHLNRIYATLGVHSQARLIHAVRSGAWSDSELGPY